MFRVKNCQESTKCWNLFILLLRLSIVIIIFWLSKLCHTFLLIFLFITILLAISYIYVLKKKQTVINQFLIWQILFPSFTFAETLLCPHWKWFPKEPRIWWAIDTCFWSIRLKWKGVFQTMVLKYLKILICCLRYKFFKVLTVN